MNRIVEVIGPAIAPILSKHQDRVLSLRFRKALGRKRQNPPESFYDKIFWMSANSDTSLWTTLADKIRVREYVAERCGEEILPELYATYENASDIDFDMLPDAFAIKTNNGCASNYLVRSKANADFEAIRSGLAWWLRFPYGELTGQLHYAKIPPRVLAEELLFQAADPNATLVDYKFYCFGGEPRYCYVVTNREFDKKHTHTRMIYDTSWRSLEDSFIEGKPLAYSDKPITLNEMLNVSRRLSDGIPFVRVDLYEVNGRVKFSEMTFMPGMDPGFTEKFQRNLGERIALPGLLSKNSATSPMETSISTGDENA